MASLDQQRREREQEANRRIEMERAERRKREEVEKRRYKEEQERRRWDEMAQGKMAEKKADEVKSAQAKQDALMKDLEEKRDLTQVDPALQNINQNQGFGND